MNVLLVLLIMCIATAVGIGMYLGRIAPVGYEDENGFHFGAEPNHAS